MWRKLRSRSRARRATKAAAAAAPSTALPSRPDAPPRHSLPAESPPIVRSPSLPHPSPPTADAPARARTDMGTPADTSVTSPRSARHSHHLPPLRVPAVRPSPDPPTAPASRHPALSHEHSRNRRLSLDGELPPSAIRPDDDEGLRDDAVIDGLYDVFPDAFCPAVLDISACSKAGWEPVRGHLTSVPPMHTVEVRKENQDTFCVYAPFRPDPSTPYPVPDRTEPKHNLQIFLGVFDGHGAQGRQIAHYARDYISAATREASEKLGTGRPTSAPLRPVPHELHRARLDILKAAFSRAERALTESDSGIDHVFSGTTAVVSWLFGRDLYTAWTGDSRCVIGRAVAPENGRIRFRAVDLSHDQKPVRIDEKRRVRSAGGRIARWQRNSGPLRVWLPRDWTPGLAMTRSIGDTVLSEYGVSPVPEVSFTSVGPADSFMVLASDGVWEFMSSQEVVDFIGRKRWEGRSASDASEALVREAVRRWRRNEPVVDDTTAVVMWITWSDGDEGDEDGGTDAASDGGKVKGESLLGKPRKVFSKTRAKVSLKQVSHGVHLVADDGHLTDFNCKNDLFQGM